MPATPTAALVDALRRWRLLDTQQLDLVECELAARFPAAKELLAELERRRWLTSYQAGEIRANRGAGLVLGSYVLLEKLGEGGMGEVFKAHQTKLGRLVAIKVIHQERLSNPDAARRFEREIRAAAQL